ncbi:MAG: hypothetical protein ACX933_08405 [Marinobacter adhaerens]
MSALRPAVGSNGTGEQPLIWRELLTAFKLKQAKIDITVNEKPESIAIDPDRRLIGLDRTDNLFGF